MQFPKSLLTFDEYVMCQELFAKFNCVLKSCKLVASLNGISLVTVDDESNNDDIFFNQKCVFNIDINNKRYIIGVPRMQVNHMLTTFDNYRALVVEYIKFISSCSTDCIKSIPVADTNTNLIYTAVEHVSYPFYHEFYIRKCADDNDIMLYDVNKTIQIYRFEI